MTAGTLLRYLAYLLCSLVALRVLTLGLPWSWRFLTFAPVVVVFVMAVQEAGRGK